MAGKQFSQKKARYPADQKFRRNRSISLHFRDKHVFVFYAEIQDGRKSAPENVFLVKVTSRIATYPAGQKFRRYYSISLCFQGKQVFVFNAEIQDGRQKRREKRFLQKVTSRLRRNCSI